eukprot:GHVQ01027437.1.p1 GENE.GHVQ01027437.1~~GHVQ01027437.1.p1  ORF type:complete len:531 (+),score=68.33 GHVQ01027437.1:232-1593(+)
MADGAAIQHNSQQSLHGLISPGRISHITRAHMRPSSLQRDIIPRNIIRSADRRTSRHHNSTNCNVPLNIGGGAIDRVHRMPCMIQPVGRLYSSTDVSQVTGGSGVGVSVVEGGGGNGGGQVPPVSCRGGVMGSQGIGRVGSNIVFEWVEKRPVTMSVLGGLALVGYLGRQLLEVPFRTYHGASSVADAYDRWTEEAIVEHYWGDHVHLGYYTDEQRSQGAFRQDYKKVREVFIDKLMDFGKVPRGEPVEEPTQESVDDRQEQHSVTDPAAGGSPPSSAILGSGGWWGRNRGDNNSGSAKSHSRGTQGNRLRVLDLGCGIGGTSRHLARHIPGGATVTGVALSPKQVERARKLTREKGLSDRCEFMVMDGQKMSFPDNSFDLVWVCESTEHMPDKDRVISEISRVTKPGGTVVVAVWSRRDDSLVPYAPAEKKALKFLCDRRIPMSVQFLGYVI